MASHCLAGLLRWHFLFQQQLFQKYHNLQIYYLRYIDLAKKSFELRNFNKINYSLLTISWFEGFLFEGRVNCLTAIINVNYRKSYIIRAALY